MRYAKRGRLRFTSHRDFSRAFERAVFRARRADGLLLGLQPAPPDLVRRRGAHRLGERGGVPRDRRWPRSSTPPQVHAALDEALPDGLDVVEVVESPGGSLADRLAGQPLADRRSPRRSPRRRPAVATFLADGRRCRSQRMTKKGLRDFDCRAAVVTLTADAHGRAAPGSTWSCDTPCPPCDPTTC